MYTGAKQTHIGYSVTPILKTHTKKCSRQEKLLEGILIAK